MKRDNSFDHVVVGNDLESVRNLAKLARDARDNDFAIGACSVDGSSCGPVPHSCPDYSTEYLTKNYAQSVVTGIVDGQGTVTVTANPLDSIFCPVAMSAVGRDTVNPDTPRAFRIYQATIRGCFQYDWQNLGDNFAQATAWVDSAELDPFARSGCACPVNFGCFTNIGMSSAQLQFVVGSAQPPGIGTQFKITLFGIPYSCCPAWTNIKDMVDPSKRPQTIPVGAGQPLGNARGTVRPFG